MSMMELSRVTAVLNKGVSEDVMKGLRGSGIDHFHVASGRSSVLVESKGLMSLFSRGTELADDPIDIVTLLVAKEIELDVMNFIADRAKLFTPGRGSVFSTQTRLLASHEYCGVTISGDFPGESLVMYSDLMSICCIVQRGESWDVEVVALETGACVPAITYGEGTGFRDKLGLLRITIPAEKEVISLVATKHDADDILDLLIDAGGIDKPGKGFIYMSPARQGVINTKVSRGTTSHAASIEQIIVAIDDIKGSVEWRRRQTIPGNKGQSKRTYLTDLRDLTVTCAEGRGEDLVKAAMSAGAAGATISRARFVAGSDHPEGNISMARENCSMIVAEKQIDGILAALKDANALDDKTHGQIYVSDVPKACTYLGG